MYCTQQGLKPVAHLAMPRQKLRTVMHVSTLMDFILLEPVGNMPGWKICPRAGRAVINLIQSFDSVDKEIALFFTDCRKVSANSISKCHCLIPFFFELSRDRVSTLNVTARCARRLSGRTGSRAW